MSLLLKDCVIQDFGSPWNGKSCNILIEHGKIISLNGQSASKVVNVGGRMVTTGWVDLSANFNDPGNEIKEDISSGIALAKQGGFTDIQLMADTNPPLETKSDINYVINRSSQGIDLHVSAAVSEELKGENLTEILDLHSAGAKSFSDGDLPIWNTELLLKALQYTSQANIRVFQNPRDIFLSRKTHMNEGLKSTQMGLSGEPGLSEVLTIKRDLEVLRYAGGAIHFSKISVGESVELIREAKSQGLDVTADVGVHHLLFTDESIGDFDTDFKSVPPFRSESDRIALIEGVKSGVIDAISSNHRPQDPESKLCEFDLALPGTISIQTFYSSILSIAGQIPVETLIERITAGPRKILNLDPISINEGEEAKLSILDPRKDWILDIDTNQSKSQNSPYWGKTLKGKVWGIVNGEFYEFFD